MKALLVKYPEIANIDATLKYVATLKAVTGQPLVALKVSGANRSQAEYYCKFSSGTLVFELGDT